MKRYLEFVLYTMRIAILEQFQYRAANVFYMIGLIAEPVVYLVVWSTVAASQGGTVGGYTAGAFTAYYIVWTLVRNMNVSLTPYEWEYRIQHGHLSAELLRPIHPMLFDVAYFSGWKFMFILYWLPIAALLTLIFKPVINPAWYQIVGFFFAIWGAFFLRTVFLLLLGMICFWTTRIGAIFDLWFALELILSGRLVPMTIMPDWIQKIASYLPFQWTFFFPINTLVGKQSLQDILLGLGIQIIWILGGVILLRFVWGYAIKRYSAVGN